MDIARPNVVRRRWIRRLTIGLIVVVIVVGATLGLSRLKPADPSVDRSLLVLDSVKRGLMLREVRGSGTLVPEEILWIAAASEGLVMGTPLQPGVEVTPDTVLVELSNPELVLSATNAEWAAKSAEAQLSSARARLQNEMLSIQSDIAREKAEHGEAVLQKQVDDQLFKDDLISERELKLASAKVENLANLIAIDEQRLEIKTKSNDAELAVQQATFEQAKADCALKKSLVEGLKVRAGINGVLEQVKVEVGQRISAGTVLAKVSNPHKLKAALKIPETQARDVVLGQKAVIDTRNTLLPGHVTRINPASEAGSVTVDVALDAALPKEARTDLSVDGTIELERLENVLYVGRPVYGQSDSTVSLFRVNVDGSASRISVKFGRSSVNTIEIIEGLDVGDQVILSDTHEWDAYDRLRVR